MFDDFNELYQQAILDRSAHPVHGRRLADFDATARGDNPMCGDRIQVWVRRDAAGRVAETGFEARGCKLSVASADLMADVVTGADAQEVHALFEGFEHLIKNRDCDCGEKLEMLRPLGGVREFPSRIRCTTLPWSALIAALEGREEAGRE